MKRKYFHQDAVTDRLIVLLSANYKDALKYGFYEFQTSRDWYREVTADVGMHAELIQHWIRIAALLATPIAPHFAEHIWTSILQSPTSIQVALWPTPTEPVDRTIVDSGVYLRETVKAIRDAEVTLMKRISKSKVKGKEALFDPKKPKSVRVYVATSFPAWQDECVKAVKDAYSASTGGIDDAKVREALTKTGLLKDKRTMPFVQAFKVKLSGISFYMCQVLTKPLTTETDYPVRR
jgi:leucyl-tRNA synthetase